MQFWTNIFLVLLSLQRIPWKYFPLNSTWKYTFFIESHIMLFPFISIVFCILTYTLHSFVTKTSNRSWYKLDIPKQKAILYTDILRTYERKKVKQRFSIQNDFNEIFNKIKKLFSSFSNLTWDKWQECSLNYNPVLKSLVAHIQAYILTVVIMCSFLAVILLEYIGLNLQTCRYSA